MLRCAVRSDPARAGAPAHVAISNTARRCRAP